MDNFGGIAVLVLIWIVGAIFDKKKKQERRRKQMAQQRPPLSIDPEPVSADPRARLPDASPREGSKLEQMLRQLNPEFAALADQALAQAHEQTATEGEPEVTVRQPVEPFAAAPDDEDDFMAKAERAMAQRSRVTVARDDTDDFMAKAERVIAQRSRVTVARDDGDDFMAKAERVIAQRRIVAEEYSSDRTAEDHDTFHQAVRRPPESEAKGPTEAPPTLEQAIIWREIIGPPKAFTIDEM